MVPEAFPPPDRRNSYRQTACKTALPTLLGLRAICLPRACPEMHGCLDGLSGDFNPLSGAGVSCLPRDTEGTADAERGGPTPRTAELLSACQLRPLAETHTPLRPGAGGEPQGDFEQAWGTVRGTCMTIMGREFSELCPDRMPSAL